MKEIVKDALDTVFSFGTFMVIVFSVLLYVGLVAVDRSSAKTHACLKAGMVKIEYQGRNYCSLPTNLVEIN